MKDIGERCGFHKATVQRVLAGLPGIAERTREIILATAQEMGYDPAHQQAARRLAWKKHGRKVINHLVALIMPPDFYRVNFFSSLFHGIMDVLTEERFDLVTIYTRNFADDILPYSLARGDVDGVIGFAHPNHFGAVVERLRQNPNFGDRPVISMIQDVLPGCGAVLFDDQQGGYLAATHLLALGHRHLVHFQGGEEGYRASALVKGYRQAYVERGLDPHVFLHGMKMDNTVPVDRRINAPLLGALAAHPHITAILAPNDPYAIFARTVLASQGVRVPDAMSIVGYDDTEVMTDDQGRNMLTTLRVPLQAIGQQAARMMIRQITEDEPAIQVLKLTPELIVRGSTAPVQE